MQTTLQTRESRTLSGEKVQELSAAGWLAVQEAREKPDGNVADWFATVARYGVVGWADYPEYAILQGHTFDTLQRLTEEVWELSGITDALDDAPDEPAEQEDLGPKPQPEAAGDLS